MHVTSSVTFTVCTLIYNSYEPISVREFDSYYKIRVLFSILQDATVHRSVKPHILSVFGDIALAIGANFKAYYDVVIATLDQASITTVDRVSK